MPKPEARAREQIDEQLTLAGWVLQDRDATDLYAARGVAVREFPLKAGHGYADYALFVDQQAVGAIEAKQAGTTLAGVEPQSEKYSTGLPDELPAAIRPLPFLYESTGVETCFTNRLDPEPRSRRVFGFHRPDTLAQWLDTPTPLIGAAADGKAAYVSRSTLRSRLRNLPPLNTANLWPAQVRAVENLERSLAEDRPRALIQMATGSGKTFTAITSIYRLIKFGGAQRVVFLVDRANLGQQALKEFQQYTTPDDGRKFTELYNVQHLTSNQIDPVARVCITTIQRLYSILRGEDELDTDDEEGSQFATAASTGPAPVAYNPKVPVETFDFLFSDECHRSIYNLWRQVLEYFDAYIVGLTATPSKQTFGFFHQNLVMEYNHEQAVADGVNVDFEVYRIQTRITEAGSTVEAGYFIDRRDRQTRAVRWEQLDEDLAYGANALDRDVVAIDQIRTVIRAFKDKLFSEIFPGRTEVPKTLIYAKDDSHAEDIVRVVREEFGRGNDFAEKITYKTSVIKHVSQVTGANGAVTQVTTYRASGAKAADLLSSFRNSYNPRIVVTVDMLATGTDIKPLEIVMFMRDVKSRIFFEQMKGRGVRVISDDELEAVTPDAKHKTHFIIVDAVGLCESNLTDSQPLERHPTVSLEKLVNSLGFGSTDPDLLSTLAGRLARLDRKIGSEDRQKLASLADGRTLQTLAGEIVRALDPDEQIATARATFGIAADAEPSPEQIAQTAGEMLRAAAMPLAKNPALRSEIVAMKQRYEQTIDTVSQDAVLFAGFSDEARDRARTLVTSFEQFIIDHKDEITALQVLYSQPYAQRLSAADIKALADALKAPPRSWLPEALWRAYEILDETRVRGSGGHMLTDIVSLVRFALKQEAELIPFADEVEERFTGWLAMQESAGREFSEEQRIWLTMIKDRIAEGFAIDREAFDLAPMSQKGGLMKAHQLFGEQLDPLLDELNEVLVA